MMKTSRSEVPKECREKRAVGRGRSAQERNPRREKRRSEAS